MRKIILLATFSFVSLFTLAQHATQNNIQQPGASGDKDESGKKINSISSYINSKVEKSTRENSAAAGFAYLNAALLDSKASDDKLDGANNFGIQGAGPVATKAWKTGGTFSLAVGQGGSRNWAAGAEKFSISFATYANLYANRKVGKWSWDNTVDLGYAFVNTTSQGVRKNDDKIDLYSKLGRNIAKNLNVSVVANFRSQFTNGYDYNYQGKGYRRRTSGFMAPAYLTFAPGLDWKPTSYFSIFFSPVAARTVIVTNQPKSYYFQGGVIPGGGFELPMSTLYGVDPSREVRFELGSFASVNFNKEVMKNVNYKSRLDLYANFLKSYKYAAIGPDQLQVTETGPKPQNVDVFWTNTISMSVNKWLQVTYNFDLIYDDDVRQFGPNKNSAGTQLRSLLGVGLSAKF